MKLQQSQDEVNLEPNSGLAAEIKQFAPWFHNMNLGGVITAPDHFLGDYPRAKFAGFAHAIPADLTGMTVLDVGCNAGFYALEMKRRGAKEVVGIDEDERYLQQAALAARVQKVDITLQKMSVYDVARLGKRFDVVLFMGVLYHLRHPLLALDLLYEHAVGDMLVFQSMLRGSLKSHVTQADHPFEEWEIFNQPDYPKLHFIEHSYSHDPTNWWVPNRSCAEAMLRSAGFRIQSGPHDEVYICHRGGAR